MRTTMPETLPAPRIRPLLPAVRMADDACVICGWWRCRCKEQRDRVALTAALLDEIERADDARGFEHDEQAGGGRTE